TPFDRTDIQDLITSMDDAIDQMNKTAKTIVLFEVQSFEPHMRQMSEVILQVAKLGLRRCRFWFRSAAMPAISMLSRPKSLRLRKRRTISAIEGSKRCIWPFARTATRATQ